MAEPASTTPVVSPTPAPIVTEAVAPVEVNEKVPSTTETAVESDAALKEEKRKGRFDADFEDKEGPKHALVDMSTIELKAEDLYVYFFLTL